MMVPAYRLTYFAARGSTIQDLDHLCRNPSCVEPSHLEPVSKEENSKRQWMDLKFRENASAGARDRALKGWTGESRKKRLELLSSPVYRENQREKHLGKKHTNATKRKLRALFTGREFSDETRRKISEAKRGKKR